MSAEFSTDAIFSTIITNKQRSVSPLPQTVLSDTFKEARSERRRFSTPHPRRKESDKRDKESRDSKGSNSPSTSSPLRHLGSMKVSDKVNAVETADEHTVNLSQLFLGHRFAHGAHSRLYHGIYKGEAVAVKIIRVPDDDENGNLAARLEKQFNREVTLLARLHPPNVIKFVAACKKPRVYCVVTKYLSEGSLRAYLHKLDHKSLPLQKLIAIALEIARGME
ncbi:hypothetical protein DITRI_Ditri13aG0097500 [Diplodiscus trichospermus]